MSPFSIKDWAISDFKGHLHHNAQNNPKIPRRNPLRYSYFNSNISVSSLNCISIYRITFIKGWKLSDSSKQQKYLRLKSNTLLFWTWKALSVCFHFSYKANSVLTVFRFRSPGHICAVSPPLIERFHCKWLLAFDLNRCLMISLLDIDLFLWRRSASILVSALLWIPSAHPNMVTFKRVTSVKMLKVPFWLKMRSLLALHVQNVPSLKCALTYWRGIENRLSFTMHSFQPDRNGAESRYTCMVFFLQVQGKSPPPLRTFHSDKKNLFLIFW